MKNITRATIASLILGATALSGTAMAATNNVATGENLNYPTIQSTDAPLSRQQVVQELATAQEQGYVSAGSMSDYPRIDTRSELSRDQVAAQANDWNNNNGSFVAY
ncbi:MULTISPECIES: DUF4148 domain-containing protein [Alcaligenes]|jgi:hypothetical protein|uniref:DUF4148 domain-containing protein n=2 Tax=Alcaligenes TaxID=507 RepID=A0A3G2HV67_9BURK|nr:MULTISPECIES: DUF4148 domain-containing protein [Alcaligenes]ASR89659.1 hypothetical protein AFA_09495 [Alcaligenes faecalis]AYN20954.1 DUF4148 domain-containing protein [Alcaligenes aquatilis]MCC9162618.1 DUF4148 domain-containing protein [Alcaligenes sp. MMA]MCH4223431.1 DUF4148 domain-containing protein [Alcaligenes faecalis]QXR37767.1 DUF4148 domain-containing protein [Alcaligenes aquatilis]